MTQPVRDVASEQAKSLGVDAKEAGVSVAQTAAQESRAVAASAGDQARQVMRTARSEVTAQAAVQHQRAAGGLRAFADELGTMTDSSGTDGLATSLSRQLSSRVADLASWLESRDLDQVLDEVRSFARSRPGYFIAACVAAGAIGGRLTRALSADSPTVAGVDPKTVAAQPVQPSPRAYEEPVQASVAYDDGMPGNPVDEPGMPASSTADYRP